MNLLHTIETTIRWAVPISMILFMVGVWVRMKFFDIFGF
jgi:cytochrome c-type biogenesis protein CcmH/NrfF